LNPRRLRTAFGYADWWKLQALVYMLRHPAKPTAPVTCGRILKRSAYGSAHSISAASANGTASGAMNARVVRARD